MLGLELGVSVCGFGLSWSKSMVLSVWWTSVASAHRHKHYRLKLRLRDNHLHIQSPHDNLRDRNLEGEKARFLLKRKPGVAFNLKSHVVSYCRLFGVSVQLIISQIALAYKHRAVTRTESLSTVLNFRSCAWKTVNFQCHADH